MAAENGKEEQKEEKQEDTGEVNDQVEDDDDVIVIEDTEDADKTENGDKNEESQEQNPSQEETEQQEGNDDDEMVSIASSDLSMADEACENSVDEEELEETDEVIECDSYDPVEDFDPESFKPAPTKHIRPPWFKHSATECDAKNWEIFVEAIEAFDRETIFEGIDDFIVTIETLLPHLSSCFVTLMKDNALSEKDVATKVMEWLEICFSKEVQAHEEAKKMHEIAFGILKAVAESSKKSVIGKHLVESGVIEVLAVVMEESECADLRMKALHTVFQWISSPTLWRVSNARLCEGNSEDKSRTLHSRLVAMSLAHRYFISKNFLHLMTLVMSWSRFLTALTGLECASRNMVNAVYRTAKVEDLPMTELWEKWDAFVLSFNALRDYIIQFDDEKVCASFDIYGVLQSSDFLGICVRLLTMSRVADRFPNVLQFVQSLLNDKYYGTMFIIHDTELIPLLKELKLFADIQNESENSISQSFDYFEEGVCEFDEKFPSAAEMRLTILYRLRVLHLLDELRSSAGTMRHNIDDDTRVSALMSLCELCNDTTGRGLREVVYILAQKYVYYIMDIIEYAAAHSHLRSSSSFTLSLHILATVVTYVDDPRFWIRNAKPFSRLVSSKGGITSSMHKKLYEYLTPFTEPLLQNLGSAGSDVVGPLIKGMKAAFERRMELTPILSTNVRVLEAVLVNANSTTRLELFHTMEQDGSLDSLIQWSFGLAQNRHSVWQAGEPSSSEAAKRFHVFAFPVLRIFASYIKTCNELIGGAHKSVTPHEPGDAKNPAHLSPRTIELRTLSDAMMDTLLLMWSSAGGVNGQRFNPECQKIRQAVLDVITPTLFYEKTLTALIRHMLSRGRKRPHLFAATLSLMLNLAPWAPPLAITKSEVPSWKDVVIGHRQRVNRFVHAFFACEERYDFAEILLSSSPYIAELSLKFVDRMCRLDRRLAQDLAGSLVNYIAASLKLRPHPKTKESSGTEGGSVNGDDPPKENEEHRPASSGMVRLLESLVHLCTVKQFRMVLYEFLSHYPNRAKFLTPMLIQFERPTFESERQSRFQTAVLDLLSDLCYPSLWSTEADLEFSDCEGCPPIDSIEEPPTNRIFVGSKKEEKTEEPARPPSVEIIEEEGADDTVTALELVEDTDDDRQSSSTLEAVMSSLCAFVNAPDQKVAIVRQALEILSKATSAAVEEQNEPFLEVIRGCIRRTGVRPFFDRMEKLFGAEDVVASILAMSSTLDSLIGEQVITLYKVLDYCPSDHSMATIIIKLDEVKNPDASSKCLVKILDKFFESLSNCSMSDEAKKESEDIKVPVMYGRSEAVAKAYRGPVVEVVEGAREAYKRAKAAASVLIKRHKAVGTRMGSEVAKILDGHKGKEQEIRKVLRRELGIREPAPPRSPKRPASDEKSPQKKPVSDGKSPRKRPLSDAKEKRQVKQKRV